MIIDMTDGKAEAELLELIRHQDASSFTLSVAASDGRWTVTMEDLDGDAGRSVGHGDCFTAAWFDIKPGWAGPN